MTERRAGPFPVDGDVVVADDGTVAIFMEDVPGELPITGRWERMEPTLSRAELAQAEQHERDVRARLWLAYKVWERAADACSWVRQPGPDIRASDPLPTFVELLARAAMTDSIAETCDGFPLGMSEHTYQQVRGLLNPASARRVHSMLQRHLIHARTHPTSAPIAGGALRLLPPLGD